MMSKIGIFKKLWDDVYHPKRIKNMFIAFNSQTTTSTRD